MSKVFLSNIDLSGNQLLNARLENLGASPVSSPANVGRLIYNTNSNLVQFDTGTIILSLVNSNAIIDPAHGGTGVNNGVNTITIAGNLITTGAFNTTFVQQASVLITLPSVATTLLGKTGTASANQIPYYADANQLTTSATFTYDGTNLTFGSATTSTIKTPSGATMISSSTTIGLSIYGLLNTVYIADSTNGNPNIFRFFNNSTGLYGLSIGINPSLPTSRLDIGGSISSASAIAKGMYIFPTLLATANGDVLIGLDINPTFTNGAFTGVQNYATRINGRVLVGTTTPLFTADIIVTKSATASNSAFSIENSGAGASYSQLILAQTSSLFATISRWNSTYTGNHLGTTVPLANTLYVSNSTNGQDGSGSISLLGSVILNLIGQTGANNGTRQDSIGFRVGTLLDINATNLNTFTVSSGLSIFGLNVAGHSTVDVRGSFSAPYRLTTVATSFSSTDYTIDCTGASFTVTLPTAIGIQGRIYILKNSSGGTKTLATTSSQTIDGSTTQTRSSGNFIKVQSNNANWIIIG